MRVDHIAAVCGAPADDESGSCLAASGSGAVSVSDSIAGVVAKLGRPWPDALERGEGIAMLQPGFEG